MFGPKHPIENMVMDFQTSREGHGKEYICTEEDTSAFTCLLVLIVILSVLMIIGNVIEKRRSRLLEKKRAENMMRGISRNNEIMKNYKINDGKSTRRN